MLLLVWQSVIENRADINALIRSQLTEPFRLSLLTHSDNIVLTVSVRGLLFTVLMLAQIHKFISSEPFLVSFRAFVIHSDQLIRFCARVY